MKTAIEEAIEYIIKMEGTYLKMPKKHKKEVDAILTATTLLKIKLKDVKQKDREQKDEFAVGFQNWIEDTIQTDPKKYIDLTTWELLEIYKQGL